MSETCTQCGTDIITCPRCRTKHCYHHYCPETMDLKKQFTQPPKEIWNEEKNQREISKVDEAFD